MFVAHQIEIEQRNQSRLGATAGNFTGEREPPDGADDLNVQQMGSVELVAVVQHAVDLPNSKGGLKQNFDHHRSVEHTHA